MEPLKRIPFEPDWALIKKPLNYPTDPVQGKIQLIWENNSKSLYHRLSPYTDYSQGLFSWGKQPFYFTYPDEGHKGLSSLRRYDSRVFPIGSAPIDVIRVTKFLTSGAGILFLGKQFLLQTSNPYNETRIYNPTSPIVAAGMGLTGNVARPQRNFDTSAGLAGIVGTLVGSSIQNAIFGAPKINPPSGTLPAGLPTINANTDGKGLLRAQTANKGQGVLEKRWGRAGSGGGSFLKNLISSTFSNFISHNQSPANVRSDEHAYGLMIAGGSAKSGYSRFGYIGQSGLPIDFHQVWFGGTAGSMRRFDEKNKTSAKIYINPDGTPNIKLLSGGTVVNGEVPYIPGVGTVGYTVESSTIESKPGIRYEDAVGVNSKASDKDYYAASDIMVNYSAYSVPESEYVTKRIDKTAIEKSNENLTKVINSLKKSGIYDVTSPNESVIIPNGKNNDLLVSGYNAIFKTKDSIGSTSPLNYKIGALAEYRDKDVRMVSNDLTTNVVDNSYKLPTAGNFDAINTLQVLDKDRKIINSKLKSWEKWEPYKDDVIALYFYDVVNQKYIPFRAAVKGIGESGNASWEELPFIGRADKVYSYGGFSRKLTMKLSIVISSIVELAPTWQRINYMTSLLKPANYTTAYFNNSMNRFMIPPMIMFTLGDMYKDQPILIESISTTIPEDAAWETQHQLSEEEWKYLANYIKSANVLYGQLPREVEMDFSMILLEKERAIAGGANFGHAPRDDNWHNWNLNTIPDNGSPTKFHESLIVQLPTNSTPESMKKKEPQRKTAPIATVKDAKTMPVEDPLANAPLSIFDREMKFKLPSMLP